MSKKGAKKRGGRMINYIIYEDEEEYRKKYISIILKLRGKEQEGYRIIELEKYDEDTKRQLDNILGKKIYIFDIEVPGKSGLDLAKEIREEGDWESQIIVVTTHEHLRTTSFTSRLLMLDFVSKYYDCENRLKESLIVAFDILTKYKALTFMTEGEIYQIPYRDILYIEKSIKENGCIIVTKKERIEVKEPLAKLEERLDSRFYKTHRRCIVNLHNVKRFDFNLGIIKFEEQEIDMLARNNRKDLKDKLCANQIENDSAEGNEPPNKDESMNLVEMYCGV